MLRLVEIESTQRFRDLSEYRGCSHPICNMCATSTTTKSILQIAAQQTIVELFVCRNHRMFTEVLFKPVAVGYAIRFKISGFANLQYGD